MNEQPFKRSWQSLFIASFCLPASTTARLGEIPLEVLAIILSFLDLDELVQYATVSNII